MLQDMQDVRALRQSSSTEHTQHAALVSALRSDISQLKSNLQEQNRVWYDFYATAFAVSHA